MYPPESAGVVGGRSPTLICTGLEDLEEVAELWGRFHGQIRDEELASDKG